MASQGKDLPFTAKSVFTTKLVNMVTALNIVVIMWCVKMRKEIARKLKVTTEQLEQ